MTLYRLTGTVEYKTVYNLQGEIKKFDRQHTFCREFKAESPRDAYEKLQASIMRKYTDRPNFATKHEDIRITECKMYEMKEITEW